MAAILRFLTSLRTSPQRAILVELAFIVLGALLIAVVFFQMSR